MISSDYEDWCDKESWQNFIYEQNICVNKYDNKQDIIYNQATWSDLEQRQLVKGQSQGYQSNQLGKGQNKEHKLNQTGKGQSKEHQFNQIGKHNYRLHDIRHIGKGQSSNLGKGNQRNSVQHNTLEIEQRNQKQSRRSRLINLKKENEKFIIIDNNETKIIDIQNKISHDSFVKNEILYEKKNYGTDLQLVENKYYQSYGWSYRILSCPDLFVSAEVNEVEMETEAKLKITTDILKLFENIKYDKPIHAMYINKPDNLVNEIIEKHINYCKLNNVPMGRQLLLQFKLIFQFNDASIEEKIDTSFGILWPRYAEKPSEKEINITTDILSITIHIINISEFNCSNEEWIIIQNYSKIWNLDIPLVRLNDKNELDIILMNEIDAFNEKEIISGQDKLDLDIESIIYCDIISIVPFYIELIISTWLKLYDNRKELDILKKVLKILGTQTIRTMTAMQEFFAPYVYWQHNTSHHSIQINHDELQNSIENRYQKRSNGSDCIVANLLMTTNNHFQELWYQTFNDKPSLAFNHIMGGGYEYYLGRTINYVQFYINNNWLYVKYILEDFIWCRYKRINGNPSIFIEQKLINFESDESPILENDSNWSEELEITSNNDYNFFESPNIKNDNKDIVFLPNKVKRFLRGKPIQSLITLKHSTGNSPQYTILREITNIKLDKQYLQVKYKDNNWKVYKRSQDEYALGWEFDCQYPEYGWVPLRYSENSKTLLSGRNNCYEIPPKVVEFLKYRHIISLVVPMPSFIGINSPPVDKIKPYRQSLYSGIKLNNDELAYYEEYKSFGILSKIDIINIENAINNNIPIRNSRNDNCELTPEPIDDIELMSICNGKDSANIRQIGENKLTYEKRPVLESWRTMWGLFPWISVPSYVKAKIPKDINLPILESEFYANHKFNNPMLLIEALTHSSYKKSITPSQRSLSIIGKEIVKYFVIEKLLEINGLFTGEAKSSLDNKSFNSYYITEMLNNKIVPDLQNIEETLLAIYCNASLSRACVQMKLHNYLLYSNDNLDKILASIEHLNINTTCSDLEKLNSNVILFFCHDAPKCLADTFCAVIAAIIIDGTWINSYKKVKEIINQYLIEPMIGTNAPSPVSILHNHVDINIRTILPQFNTSYLLFNDSKYQDLIKDYIERCIIDQNYNPEINNDLCLYSLDNIHMVGSCYDTARIRAALSIMKKIDLINVSNIITSKNEIEQSNTSGYKIKCNICNIICNSVYQWQDHRNGTKHRKQSIAQQSYVTDDCTKIPINDE